MATRHKEKVEKSQFKRDLLKELVLTESQVKDWCYHEPRRRRLRLLGRLGRRRLRDRLVFYSLFIIIWQVDTGWNGTGTYA